MTFVSANTVGFYLKGCVQGYGNYNELTTSGIDPRELFDDIEDVELPTVEVTIEGCNDAVEEGDQKSISSSDHVHLLPTQKIRRHFGSRQLGNDPDSTFNQMLGERSIHTTPSMFSLISMPNGSEANMGINVVIN